MRRLGLLLLLVACAHAPRSKDPQNWLELRSDHFILRTDLPEEDARRSIEGMELARMALMGAGWHSNHESKVRTVVVELTSRAEMEEFARKGYEGFATSDAFGQPMIVISAAQDVLQQELFKHELTHIINAGFLVSKPRWVNEGIACYLETLEIKRFPNEAIMGRPSDERLDYLQRKPIASWSSIINTGSETMRQSAEEVFAFETGAWALVHYFVDNKPEAFELYLNQLAHGAEAWQAFSTAFPYLREEQLGEAMREYLAAGKLRVDTQPIAFTRPDISLEHLPPAEVFALRADLMQLSPGYEPRQKLVDIELERALKIDPGNPYALMLQEGSDPKAAIDAHPDDWRAWLLAADRNHDDRESIERAAKLAPEDAGVLARLTIAELRAGEYARALSHAALAAELSPGRSGVLASLAQAYAANGRCADAVITEQRAIDAIPDAASSGVPPAMLERQRELREHCAAAAAAAKPPAVSRAAVTKVTARSCEKAPPRMPDSAELQAEFTLTEQGGVRGVTVTGEAPLTVRNALQSYIESCTYEPVIVDGKATELQTTAIFRAERR
jgi:tetratricopeptide (TPR) repeat protein